MAFPWAIVAALAPSLIQLLSGGNKNQQTTTTDTAVTQPARGYSSPTLPLMDMFLQDSLMRGYGSMAGAGMPGGKANVSPYMQAIMQLLADEMPGIIEYYRTGNKAYQTPATQPGYTPSPGGAYPNLLG